MTQRQLESPHAPVCATNVSLSHDEATRLANIFKALSHPVRVQLLQFIHDGDGELCACNIEKHFDLTQPTISHHIKILREAGLIISENRGVWVHHRIHPPGLAIIQAWLSKI
ncbi:MAG: transcriptional regulator [Phototrophicales bacterium]|nr:MAG: transcriptional regulator [Phototrophicales bacterium]